MPTVPEDIASWMRLVPNDYSVNQLTMPGTHDSHALDQNWDDANFLFKSHTITQDEWEKTQLDIGVRYLDLRVGHPNFSMYHGRCKLKDTISNVTDWINDWLQQHPSETVLVAAKWDQDGADEPGDFGQAVFDIWMKHNWYYGDDWPKLKDVRGKAILLRRYGSKVNDSRAKDGYIGIDVGGLYGEEHHTNPPGKFSQQDDGKGFDMYKEEVWRRVWNHINWTSAQDFNDNVQHFNGLAMNSTHPSWTPWKYADWLNPALMRFLQDDNHHEDPKSHRYGCIIMDFINKSHCLSIVSKNWEQRVFTPDHNRIWKSSDSPLFEFKNLHGDTVTIYFTKSAVLLVKRNGEYMWSSGPESSNISEDHHLIFENDGNLVLWENDNGNFKDRWEAGCRFGWDSRLRFMCGPPFIIIDTFQDKGQILWTTCPW